LNEHKLFVSVSSQVDKIGENVSVDDEPGPGCGNRAVLLPPRGHAEQWGCAVEPTNVADSTQQPE